MCQCLQLQALSGRLAEATAAAAASQERVSQLQRAVDASEAERRALMDAHNSTRYVLSDLPHKYGVAISVLLI